jgi:hypothetical protein
MFNKSINTRIHAIKNVNVGGLTSLIIDLFCVREVMLYCLSKPSHYETSELSSILRKHWRRKGNIEAEKRCDDPPSPEMKC